MLRIAKAEMTMIAVTISVEKSKVNLDELYPK